MRALIIIGIIALIFFLIGMIKVGVSFNLIDSKITLGAIALGHTFNLNIIKGEEPDDGIEKQEKPPEEEKPKKPKKPKKKKNKKSKDIPLMLTADDITGILEKVGSSLKDGARGFNFDRFLLHVTVATDDPYNTAVIFGDLNQILTTLAPICAERFTCKDLDVWTAVNFNEVLPRFDLGFDLTVRIHSFTRRINILFYCLGVGIKALGRGIVFKITNRDEYDYEYELKQQNKAVLKNVLAKVKKENNENTENNENNDSDIDERNIS